MTYELYRYIFIGGLVLSIVMLIATVLIFILLDIKNAIGDITGSNKRKGIENIHNKTTINPTKARTEAKRTTNSNVKTEEAQTTAKIKTQDRFDSFEAEQTTVLGQDEDQIAQTTVLKPVAIQPSQQTVSQEQRITEKMAVDNPDFKIEIDITYVHSNEIIR